MKLSKVAVAMGLGMVLVSGFANAADDASQGGGKVHFTGRIINAPCSVAPRGPGEDPVDLGQVSAKSLMNQGTSTPKEFTITLDDCILDKDGQGVTIKFTGESAPNSNDKLLGIHGGAQGAGIAITDAAGQVIPLGTDSTSQKLQSGPNTMTFTAYLQGTAASESEIVAGNFDAVTDFTLNYD